MTKKRTNIITGIVLIIVGFAAIAFPLEGRWIAGLILIVGGVKALFGGFDKSQF